MLPREHLPLALVTVALVGIMFIMYRELNALKTAVAHLSVPVTPPPLVGTLVEEEAEIEEEEEEQFKEEDRIEEKKTSTAALKSSKKINSQR